MIHKIRAGGNGHKRTLFDQLFYKIYFFCHGDIIHIRRKNIQVNTISPGFMQTEMTIGLSEEQLEKIARRSPNGLLPTVKGVSQAITALILEGGEYIQGANIKIDSGSTL